MIPEDLTYLLIPLILFCGSMIYALFGFGDALFCMPLLTYFIGIKTATPLMTLNGLTLSALLFFRHRRDIVWPDVQKVLLGSVIGIPLGIAILKFGNELAIRIVLGTVITSVSLYNLFIHKKKETPVRAGWGLLFGLFAGILGGAINTGGPPVVIFGTLRGWTPLQFVGNLQGFFLPNDILIIIGQLFTGIMTLQVFYLYLLGLPFVLTALFLGARWRKHIPEGKFNRYVFMLLLGIGILFLLRSLTQLAG